MARMDAVSKKTVEKIEKLAESVLRAVKGGGNPFVEIPVRCARQRALQREEAAWSSWGTSGRSATSSTSRWPRSSCRPSWSRTPARSSSSPGRPPASATSTTSPSTPSATRKQNTFEEQDESDPIIEDLEVALDALREELHLFASRKGTMVGPITIRDSGDTIDLRRMGSGGWGVPSIVEENVIQFGKPRGEVRAARREGRGLEPLQRGQVLEAPEAPSSSTAEGSRPAACAGWCSGSTASSDSRCTCWSTTTPGASTSTRW